jgi:Integrase core domain
MAESFFASLEKELLRRERFDTREQARMRIFWYIVVLLQHPPPPLQPRRHITKTLRTAILRTGQRGLTTRCQPKRVNSNSRESFGVGWMGFGRFFGRPLN